LIDHRGACDFPAAERAPPSSNKFGALDPKAVPRLCTMGSCTSHPRQTHAVTSTHASAAVLRARVFKYRFSAWSECSNDCGLGVQSREVECIDDGAAADEPKPPQKKCSQPPPPAMRECNATLCRPCEVWQESPRMLNTSEGWLSDGDGQYGNNLNCVWLIKPPMPGTLVLRFHTLSLEMDHDFLRVYDGLEPLSGKLLAFISGDPIAEPVLNPIMGAGPYRAKSGSMYLRLSSDNWRTAEGFVASWTVEPYTADESPAAESRNSHGNLISEGQPQLPEAPALASALPGTAKPSTPQAQPPATPGMAAAPSQQAAAAGAAAAEEGLVGLNQAGALPAGGAGLDARGMLLKVGLARYLGPSSACVLCTSDRPRLISACFGADR
jgi:hypothetical protein